MKDKIKNLIADTFSGEWGGETTGVNDVKVIRTANFTNEGAVNFNNIVSRNINASKVQRKKLIQGDIIIEKSGGSPTQPVGRVVFFDIDTNENFLSNNFTAVLRADKQKVYPRFLFYQLLIAHRNGRTIKHQNKTTGIINLKLDTFLEELVEVPTIPEQIKITKVLDKAEAVIKQRKENIALLDLFLNNLFLKMFGESASNENNEKSLTLRELSLRFSDGPFGSNLKTEHYSDIGIQVIRLQNVGVNEFVEKDISYVNKTHYENVLKKYSCYPGDVIIATMGDPNIRACIVPKHVSVSVNKADCVLFRVNPKLSNPHYISHLLNSKGFLFLASSFIHGQTRARISSGQIAEIAVPVPPLNQQTRFAQIVEKVDAIKGQLKSSLKELENLYDSLSQKVFEGELDIKMDISSLNIPKKTEGKIVPIEVKQEIKKPTIKLDREDSGGIIATGDIITINRDKRRSTLTWDHISVEQISNWIKEVFTGFHFNAEILLHFLAEEQGVHTHYYSSEELKKNPKANEADDFKSFIFSSVSEQNPFLNLEQLFYDEEANNISLKLRPKDHKLIKDKPAKERTGVYLSIIE